MKKIKNRLYVGVRYNTSARTIRILKYDVKRENQLLVKQFDKDLKKGHI